MPISEARLAANRRNAAKSTGPRTQTGKERSRRNGLKHGLTGQGVALPTEDRAEIERRFAALQDEMRPESGAGEARLPGTSPGAGPRSARCCPWRRCRARRYNPALRAFSERLKAAGKPAKVVTTAVARKLLTIANAVLRTGRPWDRSKVPATG